MIKNVASPNLRLAVPVLAALGFFVPFAAFATPETESLVRDEYVIGIGDELGIKFFYNPVLNEEVIVRPDGRISLQLIDEVTAAGMTPSALAARLQQLYATELDRPEIAVIVRSFAAQRVFVDGEVKKPGELALTGGLTILQAIAKSGGVTDRAKLRDVLVVRKRPDGSPLVIRIDVRRSGSKAARIEDIPLAPYDVVFVSRKAIANVNIWVDQYIRQNIPVSFGFRLEVD